MKPKVIAGVVLAGGRSSRMGFDKALAELAGRRLVERVVARLEPQVSETAISCNEPNEAITALGHEILPDRSSERLGPLAGILAALHWAAGRGHDFVATAAVDTPFLPVDLVERLARPDREGLIAMARSAGRVHPAFALWPTSLTEALARHLDESDDRSVMGFSRGRGLVAVDFPPVDGCDPFFNVNTPEDLDQARRMLAGEVT